MNLVLSSLPGCLIKNSQRMSNSLLILDPTAFCIIPATVILHTVLPTEERGQINAFPRSKLNEDNLSTSYCINQSQGITILRQIQHIAK